MAFHSILFPSTAFAIAMSAGLEGADPTEEQQPLPDKPTPTVTLDELIAKRADPMNDPRCGTIQALGPALGASFEARFRVLWGSVFALVPHPGFHYQEGTDSSFAISWPWSLPFGPASERQVTKRFCVNDQVDEHKPHRLLAEPGIVFTGKTTVFVRPGYRFVWHPKDWRFGVGAGIGSTMELRGEHGFRASLSPELLVQFGKCCKPFYSMLALRYDRFFTDNAKDAVLVNIGITYF
jgi:hypothetical protein